jgi:flagellar P-ring protein precursor FlgI
MPRIICILLALALLALPARAGTTVNEIARIQGQGESFLRGMGLVVGLNGTGDSGKDLALARPLAEVYKNNGIPVLVDELKSTSTVAVVMVLCTVPEGGARTDDRFDISVSAVGNAKSLAGGTLYLAPLAGPYQRDLVYAIAEGKLTIEDPTSPRSARVRSGARMIRDIKTGAVGESFTLVLRTAFSGWSAASEVATTITQNIYGKSGRAAAGLPQIATVLDERSVRIDIPPVERANAAAFIADVLSTPINMSLLKLPAQVIYNRESGVIILTGDVEISPVAITQKDLTITTTVPAPVPTPESPLIETKRWTSLGTNVKNGERAKLQDLLDAFNQLKIPVEEQINILSMLEKTGKLHARLVID